MYYTSPFTQHLIQNRLPDGEKTELVIRTVFELRARQAGIDAEGRL
jgi:hypothetical protein